MKTIRKGMYVELKNGMVGKVIEKYPQGHHKTLYEIKVKQFRITAVYTIDEIEKIVELRSD